MSVFSILLLFLFEIMAVKDQQGHVYLLQVALVVSVLKEVFEEVLPFAHHDDEVHLVFLDVLGQEFVDILCGH